MSRRVAPECRAIYASEIRAVSVDFSGVLDEGETLTSVLSIDDPSNELAITGTQVNSAPVDINGVSVPAGLAVQFLLDHNGATQGNRLIDIECSTSAGQEVVGSVPIKVYG